MKKTAFRYLWILVGILALTSLALAGCQGSSLGTYNENPDVSQKVIGSKFSPADSIPVMSLDPLIGWADLIVIGQVTSDGVGTSESVAFPNQEIANKVGAPVEVGLSRSAIKIERVLYGEVASDAISIVQFGNPGNDQGETKVKKGDRMLLILKQHHDVATDYTSVAAEEGMFLILNGNKVMSMTDNLVLAKYDGTN